MRPRQATTFDNCHNQLRDVLHPILGLQTGRYLRESSKQRYMEVVRRRTRPTQRTSRRFLTDQRAEFCIRRVVAADRTATGVARSAGVPRLRRMP